MNNLAEKNKWELVDLIVILSYYLFFALLILSLAGLFNKYWVAGTLLVSLFFVFYQRRQIKFSKGQLYFFILVPFLFIGFILFKGYFSGDALTFWLPWAKAIVLEGRMPESLLNIANFINGRMPFLPLLFAAIFLFLSFQEVFAAVIPFFFVSATALLLYQWAKEKEIDKKYLIFIPLLFLANPLTLRYAWDLLQEPLIIFFFTAFFYYLEKYQRENKAFYFFLMIFSFVLAAVSKETGLILIFPLFLAVTKKNILKNYGWLIFFISAPLILWLLRNYFIYGNPVSPFLNGLFKGPFYELIQITEEGVKRRFPSFDSPFARLGFVFQNLLLTFPFIFFSLCGLWKEKRVHHFLTVPVFLFLESFSPLSPGSAMRHLYPLLGILLIYGLMGLKYIQSRLSLSFLFFLAVFGLFGTEIYLSQSGFIAPLERVFGFFLVFSRFIYDHRLLWAVVLFLFFYFFLSNSQYPRYLILLIFFSYLVKTSTLSISWLNIWLPILLSVFFVLIWRHLERIKELFLRKLIISYLIILLILNTWGLALVFFAAHGQFIFPKLEIYNILPLAADRIRESEGDNKNFYIFVSGSSYLEWKHDYKVISADTLTIYYITEMRWRNNLTAQEIFSLFKEKNIKYVIESVHREHDRNFFDQIKKHPSLFKLILEKDGYFMWQVI